MSRPAACSFSVFVCLLSVFVCLLSVFLCCLIMLLLKQHLILRLTAVLCITANTSTDCSEPGGMTQQTLIMNLDVEVLDGRGYTWSADGEDERSLRTSERCWFHWVSIRTPGLQTETDGGPGLSRLVKKVMVLTFYNSLLDCRLMEDMGGWTRRKWCKRCLWCKVGADQTGSECVCGLWTSRGPGLLPAQVLMRAVTLSSAGSFMTLWTVKTSSGPLDLHR